MCYNNRKGYRQQFGKSAISNKKTFDYWCDYLKYFEEKAITDKDGDWEDVFQMTVINVVGMMVHGGIIKTGYMTFYFKKTVLPILKQHIPNLHKSDRTYVQIMSMPGIVRYPICVILHAFFIIKRNLLGKYFALQSRI